MLYENHVDADCENDHIDGRFDHQPLRCDKCRDWDGGVSFPDRRLGEVVDTETAPEDAR